ncbi:MAG: hypothetical protein Q4G66_10525, partial [bacterium]|nr:hypothetical protein [bacterium]
DKINTDYIKWSDIDSIDHKILNGQNLFFIHLSDKSRIKKVEKILNMTDAIVLYIDNFEKNQQIKKILLHQLDIIRK